MRHISLVRMTRPQLRAFAKLSPVAARLAADEIRRRQANRFAKYELEAIGVESLHFIRSKVTA